MTQASDKQSGWRGSADLWIDAAYSVLIEFGIDQVRVLTLANKLGLSRTSFYGHFDNREALLVALIQRWQSKNSINLIRRTESYAESIAEALFNLFDCWLDQTLFDGPFDLAIRNWALGDPNLRLLLEQTDSARIDAIAAMFSRHGFAADQARVRAYAVYCTQVGYISMMVSEPVDQRILRMPIFIETFSATTPTQSEVARFSARHGFEVEFEPVDEVATDRV